MSDQLAQYLDQLGKAHGFTLEELEHNRAGRLHPRQVQRAKGRGGPIAGAIVTVLCGVGGSVGALLYYDDVRKPLERLDRNALIAIIGATVVVTSFFLAVTISSFRARTRRVAAFEAGQLATLTAKVMKSAVRGHRGAPSSYFLTFGDQRFSVTRDTWELVTHAATYRAFAVGAQLLTFEPRSG